LLPGEIVSVSGLKVNELPPTVTVWTAVALELEVDDGINEDVTVLAP
jgi:hypothetical protein